MLKNYKPIKGKNEFSFWLSASVPCPSRSWKSLVTFKNRISSLSLHSQSQFTFLIRSVRSVLNWLLGLCPFIYSTIQIIHCILGEQGLRLIMDHGFLLEIMFRNKFGQKNYPEDYKNNERRASQRTTTLKPSAWTNWKGCSVGHCLHLIIGE